MHTLYDDEGLHKLLLNQKKHNWDLNDDIDWNQKIDLMKPLVPLNESAMVFPTASAEERLVLSQTMGLIIASCIYEMEEALLTLRQEAFESTLKRFPVSPEFQALGQNFFIEEEKHSECFKKYVTLFAKEVGVERELLVSLLPKVQNTKTEAFFRRHLQMGGVSFWWVVAIVEQHFLYMYKVMRPHKERLDPLYFEIHEKHFLEEARHAPFPYLMLDLYKSRRSGYVNQFSNRFDLVIAQMIQAVWAVVSLGKMKEVEQLKNTHPFFEVLAKLYPKMNELNSAQQLWKLFTGSPYVAPLVNPKGHMDIQRYAKEHGALSIPFPDCDLDDIVNY